MRLVHQGFGTNEPVDAKVGDEVEFPEGVKAVIVSFVEPAPDVDMPQVEVRTAEGERLDVWVDEVGLEWI